MGLSKTAENMCMSEMMKETVSTKEIEFENWELISEDKLNFSGQGAKEGRIYVNEKCEVAMEIHNGDWCVKKEYGNDQIIVEPYDGNCSLLGGGGEGLTHYSDNELACLINNQCSGVTLADFYIGTEGTWIPVANEIELKNVEVDEDNLFGLGTEWEDTYAGGMDKRYVQIDDIDLDGFYWYPMGIDEEGNFFANFSGFYDGNNFKIRNLTTDPEQYEFQGLVAWTMPGSSLRNIYLENVEIKYNHTWGGYNGSLAGWSGGEVYNCHARNVEVHGEDWTGGLVGHGNTGTIIKSSVEDFLVVGSYLIGGLLGGDWATQIEDSYVDNGTVQCQEVPWDVDMGGLAGNLGMPVFNSYVGKDVTLFCEYLEGFGGWDDITIGGLVGIATSSDFAIYNSYSRANIVAESDIEWYPPVILGGLFGKEAWTNAGNVENSYFAGTISSNVPATLSGLLVEIAGDVINSYYDSDTTGLSDTGNGEPKSTLEMQNINTYDGWDIAPQNEVIQDQYGWNSNYIWGIGTANDGYPFLRLSPE